MIYARSGVKAVAQVIDTQFFGRSWRSRVPSHPVILTR
jgi:hypothetical protein